MDWRHSSSGRGSALQMGSPKFFIEPISENKLSNGKMKYTKEKPIVQIENNEN
jgi:hypothetical protein